MMSRLSRASGKISTGCLVAIVVALIIALVLAVILAVGGWFVWKNRDAIKEKFEQTSSESADVAPGVLPAADGSAPENPAATPAGVARVDLKWEKPVDMDLEIWNQEGTKLLVRSFHCFGQDEKTGPGDEYFLFQPTDTGDFSSGRYVVSAFFNARPSPDVNDVPVTLVVTKPDGSTEERRKTIYWEPGKDQWHAFRINAATGEISDIDRFIKTETRRNAGQNPAAGQ